MIRQEAVKNGRYFFYVNQAGGNDELVFDGHSIGFDMEGREVVRANDFAEDFIVSLARRTVVEAHIKPN